MSRTSKSWYSVLLQNPDDSDTICVFPLIPLWAQHKPLLVLENENAATLDFYIDNKEFSGASIMQTFFKI